MTQPVSFPPRASAPAARGNLLAPFVHAKRRALEYLTEVIEEPYSGDDQHDSALRRER